MPIKTEYGWLVIYHGSDKNDRYSLAAALLDLGQSGKGDSESEKTIDGTRG